MKRIFALFLTLALLMMTLPVSAEQEWGSGDVDGSGVVAASDSLMALQASTGLITLTDGQAMAADVDGDTFVTANDALQILCYATKQIVLFSSPTWRPDTSSAAEIVCRVEKLLSEQLVTVTLAVEGLSQGNGWNLLDFELAYDSDILELAATLNEYGDELYYTKGSALRGGTLESINYAVDGTIKGAIMSSSEQYANGDLLQFTFRPKEYIQPDDTSVLSMTLNQFSRAIISDGVMTETALLDEEPTVEWDVAMDEPDDTEPVIAAGETLTVEIDGGSVTYIKFVPTVSGTYTFTSLCGDDTYGYLYDADKYEIASDDDDGVDLNFSITYDLWEGETYYWGVRYYDTEQSGSFDVQLVCDAAFCDHNNTIEDAGQSATCTTNGYTAGTFCEDCGLWISGHDIIRKHHTNEDNDDICDVCGEPAITIVASGTCGENLTWELDDEGTLTISGEGAMEDYSYPSAPWHDLDFSKVVIENGVTSIGNYAFFNCISLTDITIPDSVTNIGYGAFSECHSLTDITIGNSVTSIGDSAFSYCYSLTDITIPDSVTSIGDYAFCDCDSLTDITIPDSVTNIGYGVFSFCYNLTDITVDTGNTVYASEGDVLFNKDKTELVCYPAGKSGSYTIPDSVTSIGDYAFCDCHSLTDITIPDSVTSIGYEAFCDCDSLTSVAIGNGVTSIGDRAFYSCDSLTDITIPASVTSIGDSAFSYCYSLTDITIPDNVTSIGEGAFSCCGNLTEIIVNEDHPVYASEDGVLFNKNKTELICCPAGKSGVYTIPDGVTNIAGCAFQYCYSLTSITIPDSVTSIGDYAFCDCDSLTDITIPDSVTNIGDYVFCTCDSLTSVTIGNGVTSIGEEAFYYCQNLTSITIPDSVTSIWYDAFYGCDNLTIYGVAGAYAETYAYDNGIPFVAVDESKDLDSIYISQLPSKTVYRQGDSFKTDGLVLTLNFSDGTTATRTQGFTVSGFDSSNVGICTVTVTYNEKTTTFDVEIIEYTEPVIAAGETLTVEIDGGSVTYIKFVPTVSGTYTFTSLCGDDTYGYLYDADKYEITSSDDGVDLNFSITYDLWEGETYYWGVRYYDTEQSGSFDVQLVCDAAMCEHNNLIEDAGQPATCTTNGYTAGTFCDDCGLWISGHETIRKHHTDEDNDDICDICGEPAITIVASGTCGENLTWELDDEGTLTISGEGEMWDYFEMDYTAPWPSWGLFKVIIENGVTSIGDYAFYDCYDLTSITIPDSVTSIGEVSFSGCTNLDYVTIPDSVTNISRHAFSYCTSLTSITIPDSVTSVGEWAFEGCDNLTIYGTAGSYAETYANQNAIPFVAIGDQPIYLFGDVDGMSGVTAADALLVLQAATDRILLTDGQWIAADVDGSPGVTANDALMILQYATQLIVAFPVEG